MGGRLFISTGIKELDELLTRKRPGPESGLALPTEDGAASSILVIKGPMGAGKSVLTSILAYNIHCRPTPQNSPTGAESGKPQQKYILPFVVYFSYSQPAKGVCRYLDKILVEGDKARQDRPFPLILSPRQLGDANVSFRTLEKSLTEHLQIFDSEPLNKLAHTGDWPSAHAALQRWVDELVIEGGWDSEIGHHPAVPASLRDYAGGSLEIRPVIVVDPINFFFDDKDSRQLVARLLQKMRGRRWPVITTIEDGGENASDNHRQLSSFVEFEADTVIELMVRATPYIRHTVEIKKNRNSQHIFGPQQYRIENNGHSLWNIPSDWKTNHPGFLIIPSTHWFLSHARERHPCSDRYFSGMAVFDGILRDRLPADSERPILPPDSVIVIRGDKGGHKLSVGFNILAAGLWDLRREVREKGTSQLIATPTDRVLLLSLGEEIGLSIPRIALCDSLDQNSSHNNRRKIRFSPEGCDEPPEQKTNSSFKIIIREWKAFLPDARAAHGPQLIEATFKPGNLSPEEFLWVIEALVKHYKPSRMMVENTAHLRMRFPELHHERMLFPALASLTQSHQIMLIVTDVLGAGSDEQLSYGLAAGADFVVEVSGLKRTDFPLDDDYPLCFDHLHQRIASAEHLGASPTWSKMTISNVRGKNYRRGQYGVTVLRHENSNALFMEDITEFFTLGRTAPHQLP